MIAWLRSFIFLLVMVAVTIPYGLLCLLMFPFPWRIRYEVAIRWPRSFVYIVKWIVGIKWEIQGWEHIAADPKRPLIIMSKHQSAWEAIFLAGMLPRPVSFVYKRELNWLPFFGWAFSTIDQIAINRRDGKNAITQLLEIGTRHLQQGRLIVLFPEGTRTAAGKVGTYKSGGAKLSIHSGAPIVPMALNPGELWPKNSFIKKPGTVSVIIGEPIYPENLSHTELTQKVQDWIEGKMRELNPERYT